MKILTLLLNLLQSIFAFFQKKQEKKEKEKIDNELNSLIKKYKEALAKGDVSNIRYYQHLINNRLRHVSPTAATKTRRAIYRSH